MALKLCSKVLHSNLEYKQKFVLFSLADHANPLGVCIPGIDQIMIQTSFSEDTVVRTLKKLIAGGWVKRSARHQKNGKRTTNKYQLNVDKILEMPERNIVRKGGKLSTELP